MKIKRTLKYGSFGWDDETKKFTVEHKGQSIELNKIYAFAFLRFAFSVAQRNWFRKQENPRSRETETICDETSEKENLTTSSMSSNWQESRDDGKLC